MEKAKIKKIINLYAKALRTSKVPFKSIYLFGSYASGKANQWSDIDVLVVADKFQKDYFDYKKDLWRLTRQVDTRIEPHACTTKDFKERATLVASEAKKSGIRIA